MEVATPRSASRKAQVSLLFREKCHPDLALSEGDLLRYIWPRRRIECGRRNGAGDPMEDRFFLAALPRGHQYLRRLQARLRVGRGHRPEVRPRPRSSCPVPCRLFGLLGRRDDYVIPWEQVRRVGADIILGESELDKTRCPRRKRNFSKGPLNKSPAVDAGSFRQSIGMKNLKYTKYSLRFPYLAFTKTSRHPILPI